MLNNEFPPLGGGTATVNEELLKLFAKHPEYTIELITSSASNTDEIEQFSPKIQIHRLSVGSKCLHHATNTDLVRYAVSSFLLGRRLINKAKYDLIFAWSALPAGAVALVLSRLSGIPYITRVCGPDIPGFEDRYRRIYRILTPLIKSIWSNSKELIAKCDEEADLIRKILPSKKVTIIPNGVNLGTFNPSQYKFPNSEDRPLKLLCVARLIKRKGQSDLFKALRAAIDQGAQMHLTLVGDGDENSNYRKEVHELGISQFVTFLGSVPRDDISGYYKASDIFVLPSYNEGMSVSILEAMASGLIIVASKEAIAGIQLSEEQSSLIFAAGNISDITKILLDISTHKETFPAIRSKNVLAARSQSWQHVFERYEVLLESSRKDKINSCSL